MPNSFFLSLQPVCFVFAIFSSASISIHTRTLLVCVCARACLTVGWSESIYFHFPARFMYEVILNGRSGSIFNLRWIDDTWVRMYRQLCGVHSCKGTCHTENRKEKRFHL